MSYAGFGQVVVDGRAPFNHSYLGVAPGLVGVDQVNFQLPADTREGCAVPVNILGQRISSPTVTISVRSSQGGCIDAPSTSYGTMSLVRTTSRTAGGDPLTATDVFTASFPSGPGVHRPPAAVPTTIVADTKTFAGPYRTCPIMGYSNLPVGTIRIDGPNGSAAAGPTPDGVGGYTYSAALPSGFIVPGDYQISAAGSSALPAFTVALTVGSPIQQVTFNPVTSPDTDNYLRVQWTGGSPDSLVEISDQSTGGLTSHSSFGYGVAGDEEYALGPACFETFSAVHSPRLVVCPFGQAGDGQVLSVEQSPLSDRLTVFTVRGLSEGAEAAWSFREQQPF